jgi:CubicO group peptidase (beta-lactamase class C family)
MSGVTVTFTITSGGGTVTGNIATTNSAGEASVGSWRLGAAAGTNTLTAVAAGLTSSPITFTATATVALAVEPITRILDSIRVAFNLPALAGAIVTRTGVYAMDAVGVRKFGGSTPVTINDQFHIGSDLKSMTSGLIGLLVDQGLVSWNTTLAQAFPDLVGTMRPEYQTLTVRELLSQQSGLLRDPTISFNDATPRLQRESMTRWALQQPPVSARDTYYYSNVGYIIAGTIAERVTNTAFEQLITDRLFTPLGMTGTGFGAPGTPGVEDEPWQHYFNANNVLVTVSPGPNADNPPVWSPAGRVHLPIGSWAIWIQTVLNAEGGVYGPWQPATARMLTTPQVVRSGSDHYALGWVTTLRSWAGPTQRVLWHDGSNTLSWSVAWLAADAGWGVIVMTNQGGTVAASAADAVSVRLIKLYTTGVMASSAISERAAGVAPLPPSRGLSLASRAPP